MASPLDYRPNNAPKIDPAQAAAADAKDAKALPVNVVASEFDTLLTETTDHGAAQAIRLALQTAGIAVEESHDGASVNRTVRLFVRTEDADRAAPMAASVFSRREKFNSFPKPNIDPVPRGGSLGSILTEPDF